MLIGDVLNNQVLIPYQLGASEGWGMVVRFGGRVYARLRHQLDSHPIPLLVGGNLLFISLSARVAKFVRHHLARTALSKEAKEDIVVYHYFVVLLGANYVFASLLNINLLLTALMVTITFVAVFGLRSRFGTVERVRDEI